MGIESVSLEGMKMSVVSVEDLRNKALKVAVVNMPGIGSSLALYEMTEFAEKTFFVIFTVDLLKKRVWETVKLITAVELRKTACGGYVEEGKYLIDMVTQFPATADAKDQIKSIVNNLIRSHLSQSRLVA